MNRKRKHYRPGLIIAALAAAVAVAVQFSRSAESRQATREFSHMADMLGVTVVTGKKDSALEPLWRSVDSILADTSLAERGRAFVAIGILLDKRGLRSYKISTGTGDILASGRQYDGKAWTITIHDPGTMTSLATVFCDTGAVFTSTACQARVSCAGNRSLTFWSLEPFQARDLSTGLFCLTADSVLSRAENLGLGCVVVDSAGRVFVNRGWKQSVTIHDQSGIKDL
jgi:hypothetical protein